METIKKTVHQAYSEFARSKSKSESASASCCGPDCCETDGAEKSTFEKIIESDPAYMSEDYSKLDGYLADADLKLGCGLPTEHAGIEAGDTVIDLGSGAGNDVFIARSIVGDEGRVIGVDFSMDMLELARINKEKLGFSNVDFVLGEIENIPLPDNTADVVVSNCVMNLVPDKRKSFSETRRVLKDGGHFSISDIVYSGEMPDDLKENVQLLIGCVAGAVEKQEYIDIIKESGFGEVEIVSEKKIDVDLDNLLGREIPFDVYSITVNATK